MNSPNFFIRLFLSVTIFTFFNACHKPDADPPDNKEYVVAEIKYDNATNGEQFFYNNAWQLTGRTEIDHAQPRITGTNKYDYTYNGDGRVTRVDIYRSAANYMYVNLQELSYNNDGRLVTVSEYGKGTNILLYSSEYEYNGKNVIQKHYTKSVPDFIRTYTLDDNGNITRSVTDFISDSGLDYVEEWLDYDDKQNLLGPSAGDVRSKNNYRYYSFKTANQSMPTEIRFLYTYKNGKYVDRFIKTGTVMEKAKVTWVAKQ